VCLRESNESHSDMNANTQAIEVLPGSASVLTTPRWRRAAGAAVLSLLAACSGGGDSGGGGGNTGGGGPTDNGSGSFFLPQGNSGGNSNNLRIVGMEWGRLIDVFDLTGDPQNPTTLVFKDLLIDHSLLDSTLDYTFTANPVTGKDIVTVNYPRDSPQFLSTVQELIDAQPVQAKGLSPSELPPFTAVSRNSALVLNFNDLIDPATITPQNVILLVGNPPVGPFEARIFPASTHGGMSGGTYFPTRVIVDFTISTLEAQADPNLQVNTLGLPSAVLVTEPNAVLRIPTLIGSGQFTLLTNLSGHPLNFAAAGPSDPLSPTLDVVRSFRSQGKTEVTQDPNNGFLPDNRRPSVLGTQPVFMSQPNPLDLGLVDITFTTPSCVMPARPGDILEFNVGTGFVFQVVTAGQLAGASVVNVRVVALTGNLADFGPSFGLFKTTWNPVLGVPPACFVRFDPQPASPPATDLPTVTTIIAEFSEPMDPSTVQALDTFRVQYEVPPVPNNPLFESVIGRIAPGDDLKSFIFEPALPLRHAAAASEIYNVEIVGDDLLTAVIEGVTDLAGNALDFELPPAEFSLAATEAPATTSGIGLRFTSSIADEDGDGLPDLRGQFSIDPREVAKPRAFQRFSTVIDGSQPIVGAMQLTVGPIQTPLSDKGSKTHLIWRYFDMGFGLLDDNLHNLDVEGTNWSPFSQSVQQDSFTNFSIALAHCFWLPDEKLNTGLLPSFPGSGLVAEFNKNLLSTTAEPLTIVAPKSKGYEIKSTDSFQTPTGVVLVPWPINRNIPLSEYTYWTWRDTAKIATAGQVGIYADPERMNQVLQIPMFKFYIGPKIPTIGLPLLSEYRTYPDPGAFALNGFKTSFGLASSYKPTFRAFSTGGVGPTGTVLIDPDNEPIAKGGINPLTGQFVGPIDNTMYWGQADFAVRVSRMHSVWFDLGAASTFAPHVVEPNPLDQPSDTSIQVHFRGASFLTAPSTPPEWKDAGRYDPYGDGYDQSQLNLLFPPAGSQAPFTLVAFPLSAGKNWHSSLSPINGARYLQMRVSFIANAESGLTPELSALGVAFSQ
jgi:hypothetical protein